MNRKRTQRQQITTNCGRLVSRSAFTLVELLVVIAVIGILVSLLLPAVQAAREAARRTTCSNHLKNQVLALTNFHDSNRRFPPGHLLEKSLGFSWASNILPQLEQQPVFDRIDFKQPWDSVANQAIFRSTIPIFRCPTSQIEFEGDIDYGGVLGSLITPADQQVGDLFNRGTLIICQTSSELISAASIADGLSNTLAIVEHGDVSERENGFWITGVSCVSHDRGGVNSDPAGIYSSHGSGAFGAKADGSVVFLAKSLDEKIIGALCTRDGQEVTTH